MGLGAAERGKMLRDAREHGSHGGGRSDAEHGSTARAGVRHFGGLWGIVPAVRLGPIGGGQRPGQAVVVAGPGMPTGRWSCYGDTRCAGAAALSGLGVLVLQPEALRDVGFAVVAVHPMGM